MMRALLFDHLSELLLEQRSMRGLYLWFCWVVLAVSPLDSHLAAAEPATPPASQVLALGADGVQRGDVTLDSYSYHPNHLIVEAGKPVELTLTSVTTITPHNFMIKDSAGSLSVEQDVSAGKTVVVRFTPRQPGSFAIFCDKRLWPFPSHRDKGMEGTLEVK